MKHSTNEPEKCNFASNGDPGLIEDALRGWITHAKLNKDTRFKRRDEEYGKLLQTFRTRDSGC